MATNTVLKAVEPDKGLGGSTPSPSASVEQLVRTCLNCGRVLEERKCKLFCECGYYASCSDFY